MSLFSHNVNTEILISIEYIRTLFASKYSLESVIYTVAEKRWGTVSRVFYNMIEDIRKGSFLKDALEKQMNSAENKNLQKLLAALNSEPGVDISRRLSELSQHIVKEKKLTIDNLIDSLKSYLGKMIMVMCIPISIFFIKLIAGALEGLEMSFEVSESIEFGIVAIGAMAMFFVFFLMRYKE